MNLEGIKRIYDMRYSNKFRLLATSVSVAGIVLGAAPALAGGFYIQDQSTKGTGRAYSGEVADQGAESLWWNPAAIGGLDGGSASISATAILPRANVANVDTLIIRPGQPPAPVGGDQNSRNPINNGVVPTGSIAHSLGHGVSAGLAITAPFNFTTQYPTTSWARYTALTTRLRTIDIQPTIAVQLAPGFSVGAAVNIERTTAKLGNALPNLLAVLPDGMQQLTGSSWDFGYTLGAQYRHGPLSLGASYKSSITHDLNGNITVSGLLGPLAAQNGTVNTSARFTTPWQASFGARYAIVRNVTLDATVTRFGWDKFHAISLGAPIGMAIPEDYRNTWAYAVGADVDVSPTWTLRGGVQRDLTPVRDSERDARVPDANRWTFALGATHALSRAFKIDAGANYITLRSSPVDRTTAAYAGTPVQTPILVDGELSKAHVFVLSLGGRLSF
jgi:long-chain fatty acid transport protein